MYYEDENNLYHYSYRKGDRNTTEPVYTRNYAEEPSHAPAAAEPEKKGKGIRMAALMLACALIGGMVGAGTSAYFRAPGRGAAEEGVKSTSIAVSERESPEVKTIKVTDSKQMTLAEVYAANVDSVVSINTTITQNVFGQYVENAAAGSGFIITTDGYIVTNYHVIEDANTVKVTLYNGEDYDAKIIGGDADYDIAVIKIEAEGLKRVTIGDSSQLQIGEQIAAVGNPLGELTFSMSEGIVSCVDRAVNVEGTPFNMIQVTAAINPGNSGGPLFNTYGEVVGIVSAKRTSYASTAVEGLGFAIPINDVRDMVEDIMENGRVTNRPYFAITASNVTARFAQQNGYSVNEGVLVNSVSEGGAAEKAGLQAGDIIVKIDGKDITSMSDLNAAKKRYRAGDTVELVANRDGKEVTVKLTFDAVPEETVPVEQQQPKQQAPWSNGNGNGNNYGGNGGMYDPWEFFNDFFGNGYYSGSKADDAA